ncbi:MAG: glycosyltransferase, partial [Methylohalobius sp.]|nr:glycosyltransferase [Methylohalobius sp.]
LVAIEGMLAGRPVITCTDSGGVTELVSQETGWIAEPTTAALAQAMRELLTLPELAEQRGAAARQRALQVTWDKVIAVLGLTSAPTSRPRPGARPILVLAPFALRPPRFGGANRIFHLYRAWSRHAPVHVLCVAGQNSSQRFAPDLTIEEMATTIQFERHAASWERRLNVSARDVALLDGMQHLPEYRARVQEAVAAASLVVASHPYCLPALPERIAVPLVYDAHNVEHDLKVQLWDGAEELAREHALALVHEAEKQALERAAAVLTVCHGEAERFEALYGIGRLWVNAPNGVDLAHRPFLPQEAKQELRRRLGIQNSLAVFVGSWHTPNVMALDVVLACAAALPKMLFAITGTVCEHPKLRRTPSNVALLGKLKEAELAVLLQAADVGLNPMTLGAGTNLKVLDYAACGAVVLSTPFGVRGLPFTHGLEAWLCPSQAFPESLKLLAENVQLRAQLACAARQVAEGFSWEKIGADSLTRLAQAGVWSCP